MILTGRFVLLGNEVVTGVKDTSKKYYNLLLQQDGQAHSFMCADEGVYNVGSQLEMYKPVDVTMDFNPKYEMMRIRSIHSAK